MTPDEFAALATLMRMQGSASERAARLVLLEGWPQKAAARQTGITPAGVSNVLTRMQKTLDLCVKAAGAATRR
ncbi:MAG: hypothetical protein WBG17_00670 [Burkholderiaceae bacterium]